MSGAIPLLLLHAFMAWTEKTFPFYFTFYLNVLKLSLNLPKRHRVLALFILGARWWWLVNGSP